MKSGASLLQFKSSAVGRVISRHCVQLLVAETSVPKYPAVMSSETPQVPKLTPFTLALFAGLDNPQLGLFSRRRQK